MGTIVQKAWDQSVVQPGEWVTGQCVTTGKTYTGRTVMVYGPIRNPDCGGYRYSLEYTGEFYADGSPVLPTVFAESWADVRELLADTQQRLENKLRDHLPDRVVYGLSRRRVVLEQDLIRQGNTTR